MTKQQQSHRSRSVSIRLYFSHARVPVPYFPNIGCEIRLKTLSVLLSVVFVSSPVSLVAQRSPVADIEKAAATYVRSLHLMGKVVFDPRPAYDRGAVLPRSSEEIASLAQLSGSNITADQGAYIACSGIPKRCRMSGANAIVSVNRPEVIGDTAYVVVRILEPTLAASHPINRREDRLLILNHGGSWKFEKVVGGGSIN
jgi:hypothetical protein